jgi:hypothetical protein
MEDFEKLGVFYIGREYDLAAKKAQEALVLYDSRDLVTHAVVVGMTGSGKTGLCIDLIEEAAIDNVPSILIDPKGDLTNLLLTFPGLSSQDFLPWVNPDDASRKGLSVEDYASQQASSWQKGLADSGQSGERIQRLRQAVEFVIYTPGSSAGVPVSILKSFAAPPPEIIEDGELFQERITTTVTSLLGLLGIEADPLQSREHILLSTIIGEMWRQGQDLDLATLIAQIQKPPVAKIGVLDLESFYPTKERFSLVMAMNNLIASPGFSAWLEGIPLDIGEILHTRQGKPRVAIFSIAHLGDKERMFFVSLLLNQILGWMRTQPGTTSLRAMVYMDEIFGYFPPVANPPSKQPLLTLLKQARAFGVGIVLATQNPVDLDYKGLSNTGTWFIGRLQTERDKSRVMDGLEGAAASTGGSFNRQKMDEILAGLGSRVFLMNNTHDDEPVIFTTRWCMSYLRGPLTRSQIKTLMDPYKSAAGEQQPAPGAAVTTKPTGWSAITAAFQGATGAAAAPSTGSTQPTLTPDITQYFIPARLISSRGGRSDTYQPMLLGAARVRFTDSKAGVDEDQDVVYLTPITDQPIPVDWEAAQEAGFALNDLEKDPARGVSFGELPGMAAKSRNYVEWAKDFVSWVYGKQELKLLRSPSTGQVSKSTETERDFRVRLQQATREQRDDTTDVLRKKYAPKIAALQEKIRKAEQAVDREADQAKASGMQTALSFGSTLLGAFLGRKKISSSTIGKAATSMKSASRTAQQKADVDRAKETVKAYQEQLDELNAQFEEESQAMASKTDPSAELLETVVFRPKKTDIDVQLVSLVWAPYTQDERGKATPGW